MTLTNRLSLFFLIVLGIVLAGFTGALYLLAHSYLYGEADDRLNAALDTLTASVEIKTPQLLEWEPEKHQLVTGIENDLEEPRWIVRDRWNQVVDRSRNLKASPDFDPISAHTVFDPSVPLSQYTNTFKANGQSWRLRTVRLHPPSPVDESEGRPRSGKKRVFGELVVNAAVSLKPAEDKLGALLLWSTALSLGLWLSAAFVGRWLCRRALRPLHRMASAAHSLPATELHRRIPLPGTRDELDDLGAAFNELLGRVQIAMACQQRFASQASHQLRTPLTILLGQIEVALRRERSPEEYRQTLERAEAKGQQLTRIIEALLFLSRTESEGALPQLVDVDMTQWLPAHLAKWSGHARFPDISTAMDLGPIRAIVHPELLGQAVDNLIENACKYSPAGSSIRLSVERQERVVKLQIRDQGMGMDREEMDHIFDPFFRSQRVRQQGIGGVGLGLSIVRRIAVALGGSIQVQSASGQGSTFTFELQASLDEMIPWKESAEHSRLAPVQS